MIIEGFVSNSERFLVHWLGFLLFLKHLPCFLYTKLWGSRNTLSYMQAIRMYIVEHLKTITKSTKSQLTFYYHSELAILNISVVKCPSLASAWPLSTLASTTAPLSAVGLANVPGPNLITVRREDLKPSVPTTAMDA